MVEIPVNLIKKESPIFDALNDIYKQYSDVKEGKIHDHIPELAKVNPELFGIALCTADGKTYEVGDSQDYFTIQSISKAFIYGLALIDNDEESIRKAVIVEPTKQALNSIIFDEINNYSYNPLVNPGAIAVTSLIKGDSLETRFNRILDFFSKLAGRSLQLDDDVYKSIDTTEHHKEVIAYLKSNSQIMKEPVDEHLDLYFRQCSILVNSRDLAIMSATLANNGINPMTKEQVIEPSMIRSMISVMTSGGMYNFSAQWLYEVGIPAKSGAAGGIMGVLPGQFGISVFSPRLNELGHSFRGIKVFQELSHRFQLHIFDSHLVTEFVIYRTYSGKVVSSKKQRRHIEKEILQDQGKAILIYELKGDLYFATMEKLMRSLSLESHSYNIQYFILDGSRLLSVDECAVSLVSKIQSWLNSEDITFIITGFKLEIYQQFQKQFSKKFYFTKTLDKALEWCEDELLSQYCPSFNQYQSILPLSEMDLLADFTTQELVIIGSVCEQVHYPPKTFIVKEGEKADRLFFLASGNATVSLKLPEIHERKRLTTYIPGVAFGELGLLEGKKRTADIISDNEVICYVLPFRQLEELIKTNPRIYFKLLRTLGKNLVKMLKKSNDEIRSLSL